MEVAQPLVGPSVAVVIPFFNEVARIRSDQLVGFAQIDGVSLVLVDDGSTDGTLGQLRKIEASSPAHVTVVQLARNAGKGEAIRHGLLEARRHGAHWVGYLDADLSTSPTEFLRLVAIASADPMLEVVLGARVALLGRSIVRSPFRHYTGRVFVTVADALLDLPVYDSQCGAKVLRASEALDRVIAVPFRSRWAFDLELIGRLCRSGVEPESFWEEPLRTWVDVGGSRRSVLASVRSTLDLIAIRRDLARWPPTRS